MMFLTSGRGPAPDPPGPLSLAGDGEEGGGVESADDSAVEGVGEFIVGVEGPHGPTPFTGGCSRALAEQVSQPASSLARTFPPDGHARAVDTVMRGAPRAAIAQSAGPRNMH
jgi:hypothetical protein